MDIFDILRFEVDKTSDTTMLSTYQSVGSVTMANAVLGTYEFGMSITSKYDQTTKSKFARFSLDDGATWFEFTHEASDKTDSDPTTYSFFLEGVSGDLTLDVECRKEDATGIMIVEFADVWIKRVK